MAAHERVSAAPQVRAAQSRRRRSDWRLGWARDVLDGLSAVAGRSGLDAMMIHYHGLPITPATAAHKAIDSGHAFVSFAHQDQLQLAATVCQTFAIDNGAFSAWKSGNPITDWSAFYGWAAKCQKFPSCDFAVMPDIIDGSGADNDALLAEWPLPRWFGAPVWHMHECLSRLERLAADYHRVCIGSSAEFSSIGTTAWWGRIASAMHVVCDSDGAPLVRLHGLRMLDVRIFTRIPLSSADSTNIGRNVGIDQAWRGNYMPPNKEVRAAVMRSRIESQNAPATWSFAAPEHTQTAQGSLLWA